MTIYIVVSFDEDGARASSYSQEDLEKRLNEEYWGASPKFLSVAEASSGSASGLLIIRGDVVVPRPTQIVERWGVEA